MLENFTALFLRTDKGSYSKMVASILESYFQSLSFYFLSLDPLYGNLLLFFKSQSLDPWGSTVLRV